MQEFDDFGTGYVADPSGSDLALINAMANPLVPDSTKQEILAAFGAGRAINQKSGSPRKGKAMRNFDDSNWESVERQWDALRRRPRFEAWFTKAVEAEVARWTPIVQLRCIKRALNLPAKSGEAIKYTQTAVRLTPTADADAPALQFVLPENTADPELEKAKNALRPDK